MNESIPIEKGIQIFECNDNLPPPKFDERYPEPNYGEKQAGHRAMQFQIFETTVRENKYSLGVLVRNRSPYNYMVSKNNAKIAFMQRPKNRSFDSMPYHHINHILTTPVVISSWEDGESPVLRLAPCEQKWLRLQGKIDQYEAPLLLEHKFQEASLGLQYKAQVGWMTVFSYTFALGSFGFDHELRQGCISTTDCGKELWKTNQ